MILNKKTIKLAIVSLTVVASLVLFSKYQEAEAQTVPTMLKFSGKVTETDGSEIANGNYAFTFRLYDSAIGGTLLWSETLSSSTRFRADITSNTGNNYYYATSTAIATSTLRIGQYLTNASTSESALIVDYDTSAGSIQVASGTSWSSGQTINNLPYVDGGIVDINLGSINDITDVSFSSTRYLEVVFNGEVMEPRKIITARGIALNSEQVGGKAEDELATLAEDEIITGSWSFNDVVSISTTSSLTALTVTQNGTGNIIDFVGSSATVSVLNDGRLRLGDYIFPADSTGSNPGYVLKINASNELFWASDLSATVPDSAFWATSTDNSFMYQLDTAHALVIGDIATSADESIYKLQVNGDAWLDSVALSDNGELRFYNNTDTNYISFTASSSLSTDISFYWPTADGTSGQALVTDGSGNLSWSSLPSSSVVYSGEQGYFPYYASAGTALSATSSIYIDASGNIGIGTSSLSGLLTIGQTEDNQLVISDQGVITEGVWNGSVISFQYGGLGTTTIATSSLLYAPSANTIGELVAGTENYVLKIQSGIPTWQPDLTVGGETSLWATTTDANLAIRPNDVNDVVLIGAGATTTDSNILEVIGDAYFSGTISAQNLSLVNALSVANGGTGSTTPNGILVGDGAGNIVSLTNNSANWNTAYSWGDHSLANYFSTSSDILTVNYGGTGKTSWTQNALVYASSSTELGEVIPGGEGYTLVMQGGKPTWAATSTGGAHSLLSVSHSDTDPYSVERGALVVGSSTGSTWTRLGLGANGYVLRSNGLDAEWSTTTAITSLGTIVQGTWQADTIEIGYGGTGLTSYSAGSLLIATNTDELAELSFTDNGEILQLVGGMPTWVSTSSLGIDFGGVGGTLDTDQGGTAADSSSWNGVVQVVGGNWGTFTGVANEIAYWSDANTITSETYLNSSRGGLGADFSGETGFVYFDGGGVAVASNTIDIMMTNLTNGSGLVWLSSSTLALDTSGDWSGTIDSIDGSNIYTLSAWYATTTDGLSEGLTNRYYNTALFAGDLAGTTTDALAEGSSNLYWTNGRFDTRLTATTSVDTLLELQNLSWIGTIGTGTWQGSTINEIYGGTGLNSYSSGSMLYADGVDSLAELGIGSAGYILQSVGGFPQWVSTTSLGIDINAASGTLSTVKGGTGEDSSAWDGIVQVVGGTWGTFTGTANEVAYWSDANTIISETYLNSSRGGLGADFSGETGFVYFDGGGVAVASNTIDIMMTNLTNGSGLVWLSSSTLALDTSGDWSGTLDGVDGNDIFTLTTWYATTTDGLNEGLTNQYWTNERFDTRLSATTSIDTLLELQNLEWVGTIGTGTWQGSTIDEAYGGLGQDFSVIPSQAIVFATSSGDIDWLPMGADGEVLVVNGSSLAWSSSSPTAQHNLLSVTHSDASGTTTISRGDIIVRDLNDDWNRLELGAEGYILMSDGTDVTWSTTTNITALGTILVGVWNGTTIDIAYGGTGATTATGARENLDLDENYKFGIRSTGTDGEIWQSDGDGRGQWVSTSSLGIASGDSLSTFVGTTTQAFDGSFATGTLVGYAAANQLCEEDFPGSHFCRTYDILVSVENGDASSWTYQEAWVAEGPPGFTSNSNDCNGWTSNATDRLGAWWEFDSGGGKGWLIYCNNTRPIACCTR